MKGEIQMKDGMINLSDLDNQRFYTILENAGLIEKVGACQ
jgi:hypothetical protein